MRSWFAAADPEELVSAHLIRPEAHRASRRREPALPSATVDAVLGLMNIVDLLAVDLDAASRDTRRLRTADALHLATAERVRARSMIVFDAELAQAARSAGLDVVAPA